MDEDETAGESEGECTHLDRHWATWYPGFLGDSSDVVHSDASSVQQRAGQTRQLDCGCASELNKQVLHALLKVSRHSVPNATAASHLYIAHE